MLALLASLALISTISARLPELRSACPAVPAAATVLPATIPVDVWNNHVYVKVCHGGQELDFILDTGAGSTSIDLNTAKRFGDRIDHGYTVGGAGPGRVAAARVEKDSITLAGSSITQPVVQAVDLSRLPAREGHRIDGILGYDFITRFVVAIDYARRELRLYDHAAFRYAGPGTSVPVKIIDRFPHIDAVVKLDDGETLTGRFVVDVGSGGALSLTKPFVDEHRLRERVGQTIRRGGSGGIGGTMASDIGRVAMLSIGGMQLPRPITMLFGDSAGVFSRRGPWVGNIGGAILDRFTLLLDYQGSRMIFEPNASFAEPFDADMSGASLAMDDSLAAIVVETVVRNTPAAESGLEPGDVVVSIDGAPPTQQALGALRERLRRPGERIVLLVRRNGEMRRIEFVTRRLV